MWPIKSLNENKYHNAPELVLLLSVGHQDNGHQNQVQLKDTNLFEGTISSDRHKCLIDEKIKIKLQYWMY